MRTLETSREEEHCQFHNQFHGSAILMSDASKDLFCTPPDGTEVTEGKLELPYLQEELEIMVLLWLDYFLSPAEAVHNTSDKKNVYQEPPLAVFSHLSLTLLNHGFFFSSSSSHPDVSHKNEFADLVF